MQGVKIKPISQKTIKNTASTWGVPWQKGQLKRKQEVSVFTESGEEIPAQTKVSAYWPDGSVKWTKTSALFEKGLEEVYMQIKPPTKKYASITIEETDEALKVHTGRVSCTFNKEENTEIIKQICDQQGNVLCRGGKLVCINESVELTEKRVRVESDFEGKISYLEVEEAGPYRCVVRVKGLHSSAVSQEMSKMLRNFIPFDIRFYFYANQSQIKIVHTLLFDGNPQTDFIKGLGISFRRPMQGEAYNRYVRLGGETGLFSESPKLLGVWRITPEDQKKYEAQIRGEEVTFDKEKDKKMLELLAEAPLWNDYKVMQESSRNYLIEKRTAESYCYIKAATGERALGIAYIGDHLTGGMSVYMDDFWEKYPSQLEIKNAASKEATVNVWFWSPDAKAMDLRHYSPSTHPQSEYEGFHEMRATPYGVGNTNEVTLNFFDKTPSNEEIVELANCYKAPNLMMAEPSYIKSAGVFGIWSLEDRSTKERAYLEDKLDGMIEYYYQEREQRDWFGFWDYGDIMHTYDPARHTWKYDMGGFAWQNTELTPNMWLWYAFLRSGKEEIYTLARAMTRHNSEVDMYHLGEYQGLGSRHNVRHWGCGCKEARISMAANHRYFYYLTGDERIGDIIDEVADADFAVGNLDPMRAYHGPDPRYKTHIRIGPDVPAFCSNWLAKWERYEDEVAKEKLLKTIAYFTEDKKRFLLSGIFGYNPTKTEFLDTKLSSSDTHFMFCFGNPYIWTELIQVLEDEKLKACYEELGVLFSDHYNQKEAFLQTQEMYQKNYGMCMYTTGVNAYAAKERKLDALAEDVWRVIIEGMDPKSFKEYEEVKGASYPKTFKYLNGISGNASGQFGTHVIMALELIGDKLPVFSEKYTAKSTINPWNTNNKLR